MKIERGASNDDRRINQYNGQKKKASRDPSPDFRFLKGFITKKLSQNPTSGGTGVSPVRFIMALRSHCEGFARARRPCHRF